MMLHPGPRNLITDVAGLRVGHAQDDALKSGVTVLTGPRAFAASVHVMGGAPGTRDTDLLAPDKLVQDIDALVLSGGSAFGLAACDGVMAGLAEAGRGFLVAGARVPIVPGAIVFDLMNGGTKGWADNPYPALGRAALAACGPAPAIGSHGAGCGATTARIKGGVGSASTVLGDGTTVGALVVVNALGHPTVGDGPHFWAAPFEMAGEFGGLGLPARFPPQDQPRPAKHLGAATTIAIVATDADLDKAALHRVATAAHDGLARALVPSHTPLDGDLVFAVSTRARPVPDPLAAIYAIGHVAAITLARAVARGVHAARRAPGDIQPCWHDLHGSPPPERLP